MKPAIGMVMKVHGVDCRIFKVYALGTVDVQEIGGEGRCWRVTGLPF